MKKKIHEVNIVDGPRCIKNKSKKRKRKEEEKKATEKGIKDAINYSISQSIHGNLHGIDIECFQNVVRDRSEVQKDITPIRRLPLSLNFHREGKGGVGVSDAQFI